MTPEILIGEHYADVLNGLSFIHDRQAAFLVRIDWVHDKAYRNTALWQNADRIDFGPATPDGYAGEMNAGILWFSGSSTTKYGIRSTAAVRLEYNPGKALREAARPR